MQTVRASQDPATALAEHQRRLVEFAAPRCHWHKSHPAKGCKACANSCRSCGRQMFDDDCQHCEDVAAADAAFRRGVRS